MSDLIRDALEQLIDRMMNECASSATVDAWAAEARAICAALADSPPPAPAASTTLDLDALLSPEGAYQRGTGHEDGAQMVSDPSGPEWWAPLYGCDTLDNLLDLLHARILPYLRPPVAGIDVPGCDGDYGNVMDLCAAEGVDPRVGVPLLRRAREAWKVAALPPAPTPVPSLDADTLRKVWREAAWGGRWATLADYIALALEAQRAPSGNPPATEEYLAEARQEVAGFSPDLLARRLQNLARVQARDGREYSAALCARAAELITPASDGERAESARELEGLADVLVDERLGGSARQCRRAATLLRQPAPAPAAASDGELTEEEWDKLVEKLWDRYVTVGYQGERFIRESDFYTALDLLRPPLLPPAPAVLPVPVAERPWEREEWCDAQGRCWWSHGPMPIARWNLLPMDGMDDAPGWLLPHWAIPIPQPPQGGEATDA